MRKGFEASPQLEVKTKHSKSGSTFN